MDLGKLIKQSGSDEVYENKNDKVLGVKSKKITIITTDAIPASKKLLMALPKVILPKCE